jgi:hypothetical protein
MRYPLDKPYTIGDGFGVRKAPVPGASTFHEGQDWGVKVGTPIHAPLAGTVVLKGSGGAAGRWVMLQHDAGTRTRYNHLVRAVEKSRGERVAEGEVFAYTGGALDDPGRGASGGPHLHFGVYKRQKNGSYKAIDPNVWLAQGNAASTGVTVKPVYENEEDSSMNFYYMTDVNEPYYLWNAAKQKSRYLTPDEVVQLRSAESSGIPGCEIYKVAKGWYKNQLKFGTYKV